MKRPGQAMAAASRTIIPQRGISLFDLWPRDLSRTAIHPHRRQGTNGGRPGTPQNAGHYIDHGTRDRATANKIDGPRAEHGERRIWRISVKNGRWVTKW